MVRRSVSVIAVLGLVAVACGDSGGDTTGGAADTTEAVATAEPVVVGGTEVAAAAGGMVASDDGLFMVEIPAGALAEDTAIAVTRLDPADWPEEFVDGAVIGEVYDLQPSGLTFDEPVTIEIRVGVEDVESGSPLALIATLSNDGVWELAQDQTADLVDGMLVQRGGLTHFSWIALFGGLLTYRLDPDTVKARKGQEFTAVVTVTNGSDASLSVGFITVPDVEFPPLFGPLVEYPVGVVDWTAFSGLDKAGLLHAGSTATILIHYVCKDEGEGRYGFKLGAREKFTPSRDGFAVRVLTVLFSPIPDKVFETRWEFADLHGEATCTSITGPPAGTRLEIPTDFTPTADSPPECGDAFTNILVVLFAEPGKGTVLFLGEDEEAARPFTLDGGIVAAEVEFDVGAGIVAREVFRLDLPAGEGTVTFGVSPPEAGLTCSYLAQFLPIDPSELG